MQNINQHNQNQGEFINIKFLEKLSYGTEFLPSFKTNIITASDGSQVRSGKQNGVVRRYNIILSRLKAQELAELYAFFEVVKGSLNSFRFKDETDNTAENQPLAEVESGKVFQLIKMYSLLNGQGESVFRAKKITKPCKNSLTIYENGIAIEPQNYSVNYCSGLVTFTQPQNLQNLRASFNYDIHARIEDDFFSIKSSANGYEASTPIKLIEIIE